MAKIRSIRRREEIEQEQKEREQRRKEKQERKEKIDGKLRSIDDINSVPELRELVYEMAVDLGYVSEQ